MKKLAFSIIALNILFFNVNLVQASTSLPANCRPATSIPISLLSSTQFVQTLSQISVSNAGIEGSRLDVIACMISKDKSTYTIVHTGYEMPGPRRPGSHSVYFSVNVVSIEGYMYIESIGPTKAGLPFITK